MQRELNEPSRAVSRSLVSVGLAVFQFEQAHRQVPCSKLQIAVDQVITQYQDAECAAVLQELLAFTISEMVSVSFHQGAGYPRAFSYTDEIPDRTAVCLFSGGIDSIAGIPIAARSGGRVLAVYCSHHRQNRVSSIVQSVLSSLAARYDVRLVAVNVPPPSIGGYSQTRGFLYLLIGAAISISMGLDKLIVSECGPTMHQPMLSVIDSVTTTTHPFVVECAERAIRILSGRPFSIEAPFSGATKAEMIAHSPVKHLFQHGHSCISQRLPLHDGTCFGCVVRRLAATAAAVPDCKYRRDPICDPEARAGNLLALLEYCEGFLTSYESMPFFQRAHIEAYGLRDLVQRYSLDNYGALLDMQDKGILLREDIAAFLDRVLKIPRMRTTLRDRLSTLRS
jgi:7-cyano-7-deazaguanine synthase in queuosine biosynthesis